MSSPQIILASTSPRRRELLALLGLSFQVIQPTSEEIPSLTLSPSEQAKQFAQDKAQSVSLHHPREFVIGSDTVIEINGTLLGKPKDIQDAEGMLRRLRGQVHQVHTGVSIVQESGNLSVNFVETAQVWIKAFDDRELEVYLNTKESLGKAGAYSIQGEGAKLIEKIEGDYPTIVGFPLWRMAMILQEQGVVPPISPEQVYRSKPYANWKDF